MEKSPNPKIPPLPLDVLCHHILNRLPIRILVRFSCVCKQWRNFITSDQAFVKSHLQNQAPRNILLYSPYSDDCTNSCSGSGGFWTHDQAVLAMGSAKMGSFMHLVDCCDGVLCLDKHYGDYGYNSKIMLWNPALRQRTVLPTIDKCYNSIGFGFGFDDISKDYKVIQVYTAIVRSKKRLYSNVGVYSLSRHSWKTIDSEAIRIRWSLRSLLHTGCHTFGSNRAIGIIHGGYFYWTLRRSRKANGKLGRIYLNKVHLTQPNGRERIVLPDLVSIYIGYRLTIFKGCISICGYGVARTEFGSSIKHEELEVWSMMDSGATWVKQLIVKPSNLYFHPHVTTSSGRVLSYQTSYGCATAPMVLYDLENETIDENVPGGVTGMVRCGGVIGMVGCQSSHCNSYFIADNYVESLVSIVPPTTRKHRQRTKKSFSQKWFGCFVCSNE